MSDDTFKIFRLVPRSSEFLDRRVGSKGEIYFNRANNSLRIFDGENSGGTELAKNNLSNVSNSDFSSKALAAGIGGGGGNTTVTVSSSEPVNPENGNLWLNTTNEVLYVFRTSSGTWLPSSGDYADILNTPLIPSDISELTDNTNLIPGDISELTDNTNLLFSGDYVDLDNQPAIPTTLTDLGITDGDPGQFLTTDGNGNFSFQDVGGIGDFVFTGSNIATDDSSAISFTPACTFQSDITVENEIFANDITLSGNITSVGSGAPEIRSDSEIYLIPGTTTILQGLTTISATSEITLPKTAATGIVTHDISTATVFYHTNLSDNFTADFINVPTTNDRTISTALLLDQGATARIPNAVRINGDSQTIRWAGGSIPSGTPNYIDLVNFSLIRTSNTWVVLGSLGTFN